MEKKKIVLKLDNIVVSAIMFIVCVTLMSVMFAQFKTVEETSITDIENMREAELRTALSEWKSKYEETYTKLEETNQKITEYNQKLDKNEEASELVNKELEQSNLILGKTDVIGEGVVVTLNDGEYDVTASNLIELLNELKYAGAEAISINDIRIVNSTEIVDIDSYSYISVGGQRLQAPYVVKATGNQSYLSSILSLKDSGYIDKSKNNGIKAELELHKKVEILKCNGEMTIKYLTEVD